MRSLCLPWPWTCKMGGLFSLRCQLDYPTCSTTSAAVASPRARGPRPQTSDWSGQEGSPLGPPIVTDQSTQTTGPHPSALAATLPVYTTLDSFRPDHQCVCSPSAIPQPVQCQGRTPPSGGAGSSSKTFPSLSLTMVFGLMVLGCLGVPAGKFR